MVSYMFLQPIPDAETQTIQLAKRAICQPLRTAIDAIVSPMTMPLCIDPFPYDCHMLSNISNMTGKVW